MFFRYKGKWAERTEVQTTQLSLFCGRGWYELLAVTTIVDRFELDPPTVSFIAPLNAHRQAVALLCDNADELGELVFRHRFLEC